MQRTFKSKTGAFIYILLLLAIIALFYSMWIKSIVLLVVMLIINVLLVPSFIRTEYIFSNNILHIKSGYLPVIRIDINTISDIISHPENTSLFFTNPLKRYALSGDQIILCYNENQRVAISPSDKDGFIAELIKRNANVKVI